MTCSAFSDNGLETPLRRIRRASCAAQALAQFIEGGEEVDFTQGLAELVHQEQRKHLGGPEGQSEALVRIGVFDAPTTRLGFNLKVRLHEMIDIAIDRPQRTAPSKASWISCAVRPWRAPSSKRRMVIWRTACLWSQTRITLTNGRDPCQALARSGLARFGRGCRNLAAVIPASVDSVKNIAEGF